MKYPQVKNLTFESFTAHLEAQIAAAPIQIQRERDARQRELRKPKVGCREPYHVVGRRAAVVQRPRQVELRDARILGAPG